MPEYKFVTLPTERKAFKTSDLEDRATEELNRLAAEGWEPVNATRTELIGPIGFLLKRG